MVVWKGQMQSSTEQNHAVLLEKKVEKEKDTRTTLYDLKVSERVCSTNVRFYFSHKGSISK